MRRLRYFLEDRLPFRLQWLAKLAVIEARHWPGILKGLDYGSMLSFEKASAAVNNTFVDGCILRIYGPKLLETVLTAARELDMTLFLTYGTLLGHFREGGFIKHDWDIDLGLLEGDIAKMPLLKEKVTNAGYFVARESRHRMAFRDRHNLIHLDIDYYFREQDKLVHHVYNVGKREVYTFAYPSRMLSSFTEVRFLDRIRSLVPVDSDGFLTEVYGNWRTPKTGQQPGDFRNVTIRKVESSDVKTYAPYEVAGR